MTAHRCWFGGGTAIVLANDEYRESVDIDFLVSDLPSYRSLRQIVREQGLAGLAERDLDLARPPSIDQYGIRAAVVVASVSIKIEIIHEGRIKLDNPAPTDMICGVRTLTRADQVASKMLANDDRWPDTSTFSRDLIDLAMMRPEIAVLEAGAEKAVGAYGTTVGENLTRAIEHLRERPQRLEECVRAMQMDAPRATVWQAIRNLAASCAKVESLNPGHVRERPGSRITPTSKGRGRY